MKNMYSFIAVIGMAIAGLISGPVMADAESVRKNLDKLNLPPGFEVDIYAEVPGARSMTLGQSTGTVFVGTRGKKVYAVVDKDKNRRAEKVVTILDDLKVGNGVAMYQGNLYVAEQHRIARYPAPGFDLELPFAQMREVIYDKLPDKAHHGWRYIGFGPDDKLYVTVGAPCNICDVKGIEGTVIRMNPDGSDAEIFAHGVRNSVGLDFHPETGDLYFTDNNTDMMGDNSPPGELNHAPGKGMHFGYPYYAGGHDRHKDWKDKEPPQEVTFPVVEFQAHVAPLGVKFYTGEMFPAEYRGDAFVAQHGSWNRSSPVGYRVMQIPFENNKATGKKVFIDGWLQGGEAWGRPTDILQLPDGSMLISDDYNGVIYRVSYKGDDAEQATASTPGQKPGTAGMTITGLEMPESAVAHPDGRVFVSEIGEFGKDGDGKITVINANGDRETLADGLDDPKGVDLWLDSVYVADNTRVVKVGLNGDVTVIASAEDFPTTPQFLNDIEIDGTGTVYVSDSGKDDGTGSGIYRISQTGEVTELSGSDSGIKRPNGLLMDGIGHMLVADFATGKLYRLDMITEEVQPLNQGFGGADGLVRNSIGTLFVSDWKNGKVWQLSDPKATPMLISDGYKAAADIALAPDGQHLLVPDMKAGKLHFLPIQ